jgi:hypothetical protein
VNPISAMRKKSAITRKTWRSLAFRYLKVSRRFLVELQYYACRRDVKPDVTLLELGEETLKFYKDNQSESHYYTVRVVSEVHNAHTQSRR